jgi:hypothetical protein
MVEQKDTMDESLPSSHGEGMEEDNYLGDRKEEGGPLTSNTHRIALAAGLCGILILAAVAAVVAGLVGGSFSESKSESNSDEASQFDFTDVGPDFSNIRTSSAPNAPPVPSPTDSPSSKPSREPTSKPSFKPSERPSESPSEQPTEVTSKSPSTSTAPTGVASETPSANPTRVPVPSPAPIRMPNTNAPITPINRDSETLLTFCVIADVPYIQREVNRLPGQIRDQVAGCEFLVHLGDIQQGDIPCDIENYELVQNMLLQSAIPTFIVPGDNEWNDCGNDLEVAAAWSLWQEHFLELDTNWSHDLSIVRQPDYSENFYFIRKKTLIFGLNIVGGRVHDRDEWDRRLSAEIEWIRSVAGMNIPQNVAGIVILAHAKPTPAHSPFFDPLKEFIKEELGDQIPVLYLHGDGHSYFYNHYFLDQDNALQIQHEGGVRDPVLKILADPFHLGPQVHDSFQVDRQLHLE